ncbi:hypothetical protein [Flavobacterium sp. ACN6]|uniref:hypothetical protein n=1 Tax=Flavobacterium sp. ACN6 TaxID=1920426 RepID=UPI000BB2E4B2|nr:hypothetical protein [Flavobacterium sp. ACN6]PBJ04388.1 hypothetical protein BSF42_44430 [Flavobacterium sp. ACN6]
MQKERVLVRDNKGVFLKMFKRKLKDQFEFSEKAFFDHSIEEVKPYDRIVYVVYNKEELLGFLQENKKPNVLVCLFNKQFYTSLAFLQVINNLILFDESKTSREIFKELKTFFNKKLDFKNEKAAMSELQMPNLKSQEYYKAMYFLM